MPTALPRCFVSGCTAAFLLISVITAHPQSASEGAWTWMHGTSVIPNNGTGYIPGVYGTLGTPAAANTPSGRTRSNSWIDSNNHFWLFGGQSGSGLTTYDLNDLWEFDPVTNLWTWQGGTDTLPCAASQTTAGWCGYPGVYGTRGVPSSGNIPGGRSSSATWVDRQGNFWLLGGMGFDSSGKMGQLDDLWEFDPRTKMWTWMGGGLTLPASATCTAVFGSQGVSAATNYPGQLFASAVWTDLNGNAWLFGGMGCDANSKFGWSNALWKFDTASHQWTWMDGSSSFGSTQFPSAVYGTQGVPAPGNLPGGRINGATWSDTQGHLWLFGGQGYDAAGDTGWLNDMWVYDPGANEWTWLAGDQKMNCPANSTQNCGNEGVYGAIGIPSSSDLPGSRSSCVVWTDGDGKFWLYGGWGYDANSVPGSTLGDLWEFDPASRQWTWMSGSNKGGAAAIYGNLAATSAQSTPGLLLSGSGWTDVNNDLWLFVGNGVDANGQIGLLNDLWIYNPSWTAPPPLDFSVSIAPASLTIQSGQSGTATLTLIPTNGFNSTVTFNCSGLPAGVTCTFSPSTIGLSSSSASTTATLHASANAALHPGSQPNSIPLLPAAVLGASLAALGIRRLRSSVSLLALVIFCTANTILLSACASYSLPPSQPVTAKVTVTATSGTLQHSATLSLTIN